MTKRHECINTNTKVICFESLGKLWVRANRFGGEREGRTYEVNFCPECGFSLKKAEQPAKEEEKGDGRWMD